MKINKSHLDSDIILKARQTLSRRIFGLFFGEVSLVFGRCQDKMSLDEWFWNEVYQKSLESRVTSVNYGYDAKNRTRNQQ